MKIAFVRQRYSAFGGAERFVEAALAALGQTNLEITLLSRAWSGKLPAHMHVKKFDPFYLGRTWRELGFARAIQNEITTGGYDLVQSHERIAGCDIFRAGDGTHRGWLEHRARGRGSHFSKTFLAPYHRYMLAAEGEMFNHPRLRAVICNSRLIQKEIVRLYGVLESQLVLIHNGVDLNRFRPASKEEHAVARAALNLQGDRFVFLFVGSGFERKGLDRLLETLPGKVLLLVVGKDRAESHYRAKADKLDLGDRVRFLGPQADVVLFYRAADAFVFPAIYEPFGNVVLEALACGLPVITSLQCGFEEFIEPGRNGWLVDAFDRVALKKAQEELTAVLADSLQRSSMALEARATAQRFAPAAMVGKLISLYRSLLN